MMKTNVSGTQVYPSTEGKLNNSFSNLTYLNTMNWCVVVEGETDELFYKKYTKLPLFGETIVGKEEKNNSNSINNFLTQLENSKADAKEKIFCLIYEKNNDGKHFYGIADADYHIPNSASDLKKLHKIMKVDFSDLQDIIKNQVVFTDANSLETMLIKWAGEEAFAEVVNRADKTLSVDKSVITDALQFAGLIGICRRFFDNDKTSPSFKNIVIQSFHYYKYLFFNPYLKKYLFDKNSYIEDLCKTVSVEKKNNLLDLMKETVSNDEIYYIAQGHDIINFIQSISYIKNQNDELFKKLENRYNLEYNLEQKNKSGKPKVQYELEKPIIKEYVKEAYFNNSPIAVWLKETEEKRNIEFKKNITNLKTSSEYIYVYVHSNQYFISSELTYSYFIFGINLEGKVELISYILNINEKIRFTQEDFFIWFTNLYKNGIQQIDRIETNIMNLNIKNCIYCKKSCIEGINNIFNNCLRTRFNSKEEFKCSIEKALKEFYA